MIKKILVPVDFSEGSLAALRTARELARSTSAELLLLHADEYPVMPAGELPYLPPQAIEEHTEGVARAFADVVGKAKQDGVTASGSVVQGPTLAAILDAATKQGADMIVMGTHGRRGFRHLIMGSVAERIVRTAKIPVMTVRAELQVTQV